MARNVLETIGDTPIVELHQLCGELPARVLVKLENRNPLGSVKDRIALSMVEAAEREGHLEPGKGQWIVEATSGNTGIALAYVGAVKGYRVLLTMPETMSVERRRLLVALGAELELTPGTSGMAEAVERAEAITHRRDGAVLMRQFANPANPSVHEMTTGPEIWRQTGGAVDIFVAGVGTGGTITGVGRALRARNRSVVLCAVEPENSAVISGGNAGAHRIQGIGAGFLPPVLDRGLLDEVISVSADEAAQTARALARKEGIFAGISAGANVCVALRLAERRENRGKTIVTVICDTGERYLTTWLYEEEKA